MRFDAIFAELSALSERFKSECRWTYLKISQDRYRPYKPKEVPALRVGLFAITDIECDAYCVPFGIISHVPSGVRVGLLPFSEAMAYAIELHDLGEAADTTSMRDLFNLLLPIAKKYGVTKAHEPRPELPPEFNRLNDHQAEAA